jgi:hypothetical protein
MWIHFKCKILRKPKESQVTLSFLSNPGCDTLPETAQLSFR